MSKLIAYKERTQRRFNSLLVWGGGGVVGGGKEAVGPSRRWSIQLEGERRTEPYYNKDIAAGVFLPDWIF